MAERGGARKGSGRKKMEGVVITSIRIDAESWAKMPRPNVEYVRQAVEEQQHRHEGEDRR